MRTYAYAIRAVALIAAVVTTPSVTSAQTPPAQAAPGGQSAAPDEKTPGDRNEPLSEKLDKNEGVLVPPSGIDPKIHKEPPADTGDRMPVIIPPGEPGGNQQIQPK